MFTFYNFVNLNFNYFIVARLMTYVISIDKIFTNEKVI